MCIIISKPAGAKLSDEIYEECFNRNKEGAGIAYVKDNELVVDKGYFKPKEFIEEVRKHEDGDMLIHFRIQSQGPINKDNCHPFHYVSERYPNIAFAVVHNGTLRYTPNPGQSDTSSFCDEVLFPHLDRDPWFLDSDTGRWFLETFMEDRNKMAIMRYDNKKKELTTYILNEKAGNKHEKCWFSNLSWKPLPEYKQPLGYGYAQGGMVSPAYHGSTLTWNFKVKALVNDMGWYEDAKGMWRNINAPEIGVADKQTAIPAVDVNGCLIYNIIEREQQKEFELEERNAEIAQTEVDVDQVDHYISDGNKVIDINAVEVPRDAGVVEPVKHPRVNNLKHLTKPERRILSQHCRDYVRFLGLKDVSGMNIMQQIYWVRDDLRDSCTAFADHDDRALDHMILKESVMSQLMKTVAQNQRTANAMCVTN